MFLITLVLTQQVMAQSPTGSTCPALPNIDCTPTQNCTLNSDDRECNRCLVSVFNHCTVRGNDPACEAAKAAQNAMYAAQKTQCETQKAAQKAACEGTRAQLIAAAANCHPSAQ
jgi:hypothetical protein